MDLQNNVKIITDDTLLEVLDEYDDSDSWGISEKILNFMLFAKNEEGVPSETTMKVWDKADEMWGYEVLDYFQNVITPNDIDFSAESCKKSVEKLIEISGIEYEKVLIVTKREYSSFEDHDSVLVWSPEQFSKYAAGHTEFKKYLMTLNGE